MHVVPRRHAIAADQRRHRGRRLTIHVRTLDGTRRAPRAVVGRLFRSHFARTGVTSSRTGAASHKKSGEPASSSAPSVRLTPRACIDRPRPSRPWRSNDVVTRTGWARRKLLIMETDAVRAVVGAHFSAPTNSLEAASRSRTSGASQPEGECSDDRSIVVEEGGSGARAARRQRAAKCSSAEDVAEARSQPQPANMGMCAGLFWLRQKRHLRGPRESVEGSFLAHHGPAPAASVSQMLTLAGLREDEDIAIEVNTRTRRRFRAVSSR